MLRPWVNITIQQNPTPLWDGKNGNAKRNELLVIDFVEKYEIESSWEDHTDQCSFTLPKNIALQQDDKPLFKQTGTYNIILGGSGVSGRNFDDMNEDITPPPLIMRGDQVTISDGYFFYNEARDQIQVGQNVFTGYVSKVHAAVPIEIECEDNFYLLKKTPVGITHYAGNLIGLMEYCIKQANSIFYDKNVVNGTHYPKLSVSKITDSITLDFYFGYLAISNKDISVAKLLSQIQKDYKLRSTFIGDELHFGFPIYYEPTANSDNFFEFQNNIIENDLEWTNKDDIEMSAIVSTLEEITKGKTKDGHPKTVKGRKSVLVYWDTPTNSFKSITKVKGKAFPANEGGERYDFFYSISPGETVTIAQLIDFGKKQLEKYYYTGFRGCFTTFGFPYVKWNDNVNIIDTVMADHNGQYKVKKVKRTGGVGIGIKQEVHLDFKQNVELPVATTEIYML